VGRFHSEGAVERRHPVSDMSVMQLSENPVPAIFAVALLAAIGCSSAATDGSPQGPLRVTPTLAIDSGGVRTLVVTVTLENMSRDRRPITWVADCSNDEGVAFQMFRGTTLVWDSSHGQTFVPQCVPEVVRDTIEANASFVFEGRIALSALMGDSIAPGTYSFAVQPRLIAPVLAATDAGTLTVANPVVVPPGTVLDGVWGASTGGLTISLTLKWTADSVTGSGPYTIAAGSASCLAPGPASGTAVLTASRINDFISGSMNVHGPMSGHLRSSTLLDLSLTSVDTAGCSLQLLRAP
jgi:hypothetical protein